VRCYRWRGLPGGRGEFIDVQIEREIAADKAEIDRLDSEYKQAVGEAKTKLKVKVDAARKRYKERRELLVQRIDEIQHDGDANQIDASTSAKGHPTSQG